jgi:hypothetical protein
VVKITKAMAKGWLADVPQEKQFWCTDGHFLKNLAELKAALETMSQDTFGSHSNETKNDFSNWIRDVIADEQLANDLLKSKTQAQTAKTVADRITLLQSKIKAK